ncbi:TonB-dependent receptor [Sphingomonas sp. MA1305]|uniref:TonB-dependent receptor n=1 Tax=Sphingomonas sp. MA1305 TaxID=2479204 RepID=UPI0018DEFE0E|nr:TonB-dependent receptor [Sphingomonas sp. MA1305]MBI0476367.1 TonB-dependent receptor [Sphingomonas sp. MA1305]
MKFAVTAGSRSLAAIWLAGSALSATPVLAQQSATPPASEVNNPATPTVATPANPDQSTAADPNSQPDPIPQPQSDIVVTGFRQSYSDAIRSKRNEIAITDGISSDGLGRFPDLNVGEALQRVPGVQINREAEGRNATINLRGLPGEYARLTLNGVAFAEPILAEATPLGAFNADIFSAIVIDKSPLANAQSGGLSGNVDLQIATALARKEGGFVKAALEYNQLGKRFAPAATVGYNHHFSDSFGVFAVLTYKKENFRRDTLQYNSYSSFSAAQAQANASVLGSYYAKSTACPSCTGSVTTNGVLYNSQLRQYSRINPGDLYTGAAGAEWKPDDNTKVSLTGFYTDRRLPKTMQYLSIISNNDASFLTPRSSPIQLDDGRYVVTDFDFANPDSRMSTRRLGIEQRAWGINGRADWSDDDWRLSTVLTASKADNNSEETSIDFDRVQTATGNGATGTIRTGAGNVADLYYSLAPTPLVNTNVPTWYWGGVTDPTQFYNTPTSVGRTNRLQFTGTQSYGGNELLAYQWDAERTFHGGVLTGIQAGFRFEHNRFVSRGYRISAYGLQVQNIDNTFLTTSPTVDDFFGGKLGTYSTNWQVTRYDYAIGKLTPVTLYPGGALSPSGYNIRYNDNNYALYNFTNQTDIASGYAQLKYEFEVGGIRVRGNGGLRYEYANNTIDSLDRVSLTGTIGSPADFRTNTYNQRYGKLLPSFILVADLTDKLVLRGAAYRTYVRPQPRQFTPATIVGNPVNGVYSVTLGNPDLKPYDATSFDVSVEWYNRPNGIVSLAAFQKRITGLIGQVTDPTRLCPADASALGLGTLRVNGDRCESSLIYTGGAVPTPYLVSASGFVNQDSPITVRGLEFNLQQSLDFLPGALRHLGGGFNYAYTDISGTTATGAAATLPGVSKHNANVIGYYETTDYGVRLVYNVRSKYDLASAGTFTGAARQVRARGQLDMSASYNVTDTVSLSFDAYNLTNAIRVEYENDPRLIRRADYDGRTFTVTARATF